MSALCWARHTSVTDLLCSALSARCQASKYERSPSDESDLKCTLLRAHVATRLRALPLALIRQVCPVMLLHRGERDALQSRFFHGMRALLSQMRGLRDAGVHLRGAAHRPSTPAWWWCCEPSLWSCGVLGMGEHSRRTA